MIRFAAAGLILALSFTAAHAGNATVRYGDLNLATPQGLETLKLRVQQAAETACGAADITTFGVSARTIYEATAEQKACVRQAAASGLERILRRNPTAARLASN